MDQRRSLPFARRIMRVAAMLSAISCLTSFVPLAWTQEASPFAQADDPTLPVRGVVRALDQSALSTDLAARVLKIGFREGEAFKKGELLVEFDCERYRAEAQSADAVFREMKLTLDSNVHLEKFSAVGKADVEISRARVAKAEAEARSLNARLVQCEVTAPFDGRVAELSINAFEQPQVGKSFLVIVGNSRLEVELIVPSHWLRWMKPGAEFQFSIDETRRDYKAHVIRLGAAVDAVSQMIKIIAVFDEPVGDVLPGMSGVAKFGPPNG